MERINGLRLSVNCAAENIRLCAELSARMMARLIEREKITYNQILYPYADALSLSGKPGTESTRIFGTHSVFRNIPDEMIVVSLTEVQKEMGISGMAYELREFRLTEGAAMSGDIAEFLGCDYHNEEEKISTWSAGDFREMLIGYLPHWRIRECARIFASFCEMAYRRTKGEIIGLYGGRLILSPEYPDAAAIRQIFTQKTGIKKI